MAVNYNLFALLLKILPIDLPKLNNLMIDDYSLMACTDVTIQGIVPIILIKFSFSYRFHDDNYDNDRSTQFADDDIRQTGVLW